MYEWLNMFWAMEPGQLARLMQLAGDQPSPESLAQYAARVESMDGGAGLGVAVITLRGAVFKPVTERFRQAVQASAANPSVRTIVLRIDSPGGSVSGVSEAADAVAAAASKKRVIACIEDLGASAAYWIASQANTIHVNATGMVGSIGTRLGVYDYSEMFENWGVRALPIDTGEFKSAGFPGTKVSERQVEAWQKVVNDLNQHFLAAVARGRRIPASRVKELADGRVHIGAEAKKLGLVDKVKTFDETLSELSQSGSVHRAYAQEKIMKFTAEQIELMRSLGLEETASADQATEFYTALSDEKREQVDALTTVTSNVPATVGAASAVTTPASTGARTAPARVAHGSAQPPADNDAVATLTQADFDRQIGDHLSAERLRVGHINQLADSKGFGAAWAQRHISLGTPVEQVDAYAAEFETMSNGMKPVSGVSVGTDFNLDTLSSAIQDAVQIRAGEKLVEFETCSVTGAPLELRLNSDGGVIERKPHARAREFMGRSLVEVGERFLNACGVSTAGLYKPQIAQLLMNRQRQMQMMSAAGALNHSTSDFAGILANIPNKTLRRAYMEHAGNWDRWARENANVPDFKPVNRKSLSAFATPPTVREGAEYTMATASDTGESYSLAKYGHIFQLTWETLVNDDLDAFGRIPLMHGAACARLEDDLAYAQITGNPLMSEDNQVLFHGDHNNLLSAAALAVASLGVARAAMRMQTGLAGEKIDLVPAVLLVPTALQTTAEQLINSTVDPSKANATPNPFSGKLDVVANPRLDDNSATAWYLTASTAQIDTVEVGFLAGHRQPYLEEQQGFDVDSRRYKVRHVVAARAIDHRGMQKNPGS